MRSLLTLLLLSAGFCAHAQTPTCGPSIQDPVPVNAARITWTAPTTNTDGSAIKIPILYTVYEAGIARCASQATAVGLAALPAGAHTWNVTATTTDGESAPSNGAAKTTTNPPAVLMVDPAHPDAYSTLKIQDGLIPARVGSVTLGAICDTKQGLLKDGVTYYVIPRSMVTPYNPNSTALVARCL